MNEAPAVVEDSRMAHLLTLRSATFLFYVSVTRGALAFAWALGRIVRSVAGGYTSALARM